MVSSILDVLNARLPDWLWRTHANKKRPCETNEHENSDAFFRSETQTLNSGHSIGYARDNEPIIIFNDLC